MTISELSRIEKQILLRAPRSRVWRALTDSARFAQWFGVELQGEFQPGARIRMTSTNEACRGEVFFVVIQTMEPEHTFSWRWHPGVARPGVDYDHEPTTLVTFRLDEVEGGTRLTVVESGFDQISLARRAAVFEENTKGWEFQLQSIARHVSEAER